MTENQRRQRRRHRRGVEMRRPLTRTRPSPPSSSASAAATVLLLSLTCSLSSHSVHAQCDPCVGLSSGFIQVPDTNCGEFVQCNGGATSQTFTCQGGLIYDSNLNQCNWAYSATCGPDPECPTYPPTDVPTDSPTVEPTVEPTMKEVDEEEEDDVGEGAFGSRPTLTGNGGVTSPDNPPPPPTPPAIVPVPPAVVAVPTPPAMAPTPPGAPVSTPLIGLDPIRSPHHAAVWAHLTANKITISNQLLRVAHRLTNVHGNNLNADDLRNYAYGDFMRALRSMSEQGYGVPVVDAEGNTLDANGNPLLGRSVFYLGEVGNDDAAVVGLINVAAFLSQALADSISNGSCDEINVEVVNGQLPISNSCGQYGQSYQDMRCAKQEQYMECPVYGEMEMVANVNGRTNVVPFYCGPRDRYPVVGSAEVIPGTMPVEGAVKNADGRSDVEGCCWWGRGTINTRGVCQYGKLNYYLGARAASEGRPARFPGIDFCANPSSICASGSNKRDSEIEWVSGLFRWIDSVQPYDDGAGWNYIQQLTNFVMGGMTDGLFIHSVSAIVTQGCHQAPCPGVAGTGLELTDGAERYSYFLQVLEAFGLPVKSLQQS